MPLNVGPGNGRKGECWKGLFLVIFLLELILQLNYLSQFRKMRTKASAGEKWMALNSLCTRRHTTTTTTNGKASVEMKENENGLET